MTSTKALCFRKMSEWVENQDNSSHINSIKERLDGTHTKVNSSTKREEEQMSGI